MKKTKPRKRPSSSVDTRKLAERIARKLFTVGKTRGNALRLYCDDGEWADTYLATAIESAVADLIERELTDHKRGRAGG